MEWRQLWSQPGLVKGQFSLEWQGHILTHLSVTQTSSFYLLIPPASWKVVSTPPASLGAPFTNMSIGLEPGTR